MPTQWSPELGFALNDNVCIRIGGTKKYYTIVNRDNMYYLNEPDAVAADTTSSYAEITELNPPHGQLYSIYKIWLDGNIELYMKQPAATNIWGSQRSPTGGLLNDRTSGVKGGLYTDLWFTIDNPPSVQYVNRQPVSITPKIWYIGWRYAIEELPDKPSNFTEVTITGLAQ